MEIYSNWKLYIWDQEKKVREIKESMKLALDSLVHPHDNRDEQLKSTG